jgi:hypothetical protein
MAIQWPIRMPAIKSHSTSSAIMKYGRLCRQNASQRSVTIGWLPSRHLRYKRTWKTAGISSSLVKPIASSIDSLATAELLVRNPSYFGRFASIALFHWMGVFAGVAPAGWHFANPLARHIEFRHVGNSEFLVPIPLLRRFVPRRVLCRPSASQSYSGISKGAAHLSLQSKKGPWEC